MSDIREQLAAANRRYTNAWRELVDIRKRVADLEQLALSLQDTCARQAMTIEQLQQAIDFVVGEPYISLEDYRRS